MLFYKAISFIHQLNVQMPVQCMHATSNNAQLARWECLCTLVYFVHPLMHAYELIIPYTVRTCVQCTCMYTCWQHSPVTIDTHSWCTRELYIALALASARTPGTLARASARTRSTLASGSARTRALSKNTRV